MDYKGKYFDYGKAAQNAALITEIGEKYDSEYVGPYFIYLWKLK